MTQVRTLLVLLLAIVVGTQGVVAAVVASMCCCERESRIAAQSIAAPNCPNCAADAAAAEDTQTKQVVNHDACCLKRVCECSHDIQDRSATTRRVVDQKSAIDHSRGQATCFVRHVDSRRLIQIQPLMLVENIHLNNCVWII